MINDHYEAAWRHLNKMTEGNPDRVEILEFANIIYKAASEMWPMYKYVAKTLRDIESNKWNAENKSVLEPKAIPAMEDFAKEVFRLYLNSGQEQMLLPREIPKGTMEALDQTLQDEEKNLMAIDLGNPYKDMYQWSKTKAAIEKHLELIEAVAAEKQQRQ